MAAVKRICILVLCFVSAAFLRPASIAAQPADKDGVKPEQPVKTKQIIMFVVDGLQAGSLNAASAPNINGLGMAGIRGDRVSAMPPDNTEARLYSILSGADPGDHGCTGDGAAPARPSILYYMEKKGMKTALIDGTGRMEKAFQDVSYRYSGPFKSDREVVDAAVDVVKNKKPFFTVVVLAGPDRDGAGQGPGTGTDSSLVTDADNEIGRFLRQLHISGTYEETMLIVTGTTGKPPLVIKGTEFLTGFRLPPVCLKDLAPTLAYLYGIDMPGAKGLIIWNAFRPVPSRTDNFMLMQRVNDLSDAYADIMDAAARLEGEKMLVQEEKARLTRDKQSVEEEMEERDSRIKKLSRIIFIMKLGILSGIILFAAAMVVEYRVLKKKYLFFT
jgi:hypothetical protein